MKNIFSLSVVGAKLFTLLCFSLMGFFPTSEALVGEMPAPCHQKVQEKMTSPFEKAMGEVSPSQTVCETCLSAEKVWSCPFSLETSKIAYPDFTPFNIPFLWQENFFSPPREKHKCGRKKVPDKISFEEIIIKKTTQILV